MRARASANRLNSRWQFSALGASVFWLTVGSGCGVSSPAAANPGIRGQGTAGRGSGGSSVVGGSSALPRSTGGTTSATGTTTTAAQDPESNLPCEEEPNDGTWTETEVESGFGWHVALSKQRAVLVAVDNDQLLARVSENAGKTWTDPVQINNAASPATVLGLRVLIAPDGSSAFAYWQASGGTSWVARNSAAHGWESPVNFTPIQTNGAIDAFTDDQFGFSVVCDPTTGSLGNRAALRGASTGCCVASADNGAGEQSNRGETRR
jgi:hypothetical protein